MTYTIEPAPAVDRSAEVENDTMTTAARNDALSPAERADGRARTRRAGAVLFGGALTWAIATVMFPWHESELNFRISDLAGFAFQVGVMGLLMVMMRTRAIGTSRKARIALRVEVVLLSLASIWSVLHAIIPETVDTTPLAILDLFWPLSMLGMCIIGIKLAFAGRWRGVLRFWPMVAETWAVVTVPSVVIVGQRAGDFVGASHLLIGYVTLGALLFLKPELTEAK